MRSACGSHGGQGSRVSWLLQDGGSWECGKGGAGVCWQTVEDGLWSFPNVCVWICWRWGNSMGAERVTMGTFCWKPMEGRGDRGRKPHPVGGGRGGGGWDRRPNYVGCGAPIVSGWVVVEWGTEPYSGLVGDTCFGYLAWRMSALGMGQAVRLGERNTLCCRNRVEVYFCLVLWFFILFFIFYFLFCFSYCRFVIPILCLISLCL